MQIFTPSTSPLAVNMSLQYNGRLAYPLGQHRRAGKVRNLTRGVGVIKTNHLGKGRV